MVGAQIPRHWFGDTNGNMGKSNYRKHSEPITCARANGKGGGNVNRGDTTGKNRKKGDSLCPVANTGTACTVGEATKPSGEEPEKYANDGGRGETGGVKGSETNKGAGKKGGETRRAFHLNCVRITGKGVRTG